jgi:hypothetical protein
MGVANNTPLSALAWPVLSVDGHELVIAIVKATYARDGSGKLVRAERQAPVRLNDVPHDPEESGFAPNRGGAVAAEGDEIETSVRYPSDAAFDKPRFDVVVVGDAVSDRPVEQLDLAVQIGAHQAMLRMHGERVYVRGVTGLSFGPRVPFERRPLVYELAYGGTTPDFSTTEAHNPVGRGIAARTSDLVDRPAPCLEDPRQPLEPGKRSAVAGLQAIATHWEPRRSFYGTFDEAWQKTRMPLLPRDFDARSQQVAHPSLQLARAPQPGEAIAVRGMTTEPTWMTEFRGVDLVLRGKTNDGRVVTARPMPDTMLIEPEREQVEVTYRHAFKKGRGQTLLREIMVDYDG